MTSYQANLNQVLNSAAKNALSKRGNQVLRKARTKVPAVEVLLKDSLGYDLSGSSYLNFVVRVGSGVGGHKPSPRALVVEQGAQEYIIKAKPGGFLVFPGTNGQRGNKSGKWAGLVVVKQVTHPPVQARHYLRDSVRETIGSND